MPIPAEKHEQLRGWLFDHLVAFNATAADTAPMKSVVVRETRDNINLTELQEVITAAESEEMIVISEGGISALGSVRFTDEGYAAACRRGAGA